MSDDAWWRLGHERLCAAVGAREPLLSLVLIVVLVVLAVRYLTRMNPPSHGQWPGPQAVPPPVPPDRPEPLDILRERFARGDITLDEFETAKRPR
jgi:hypothetical protein